MKKSVATLAVVASLALSGCWGHRAGGCRDEGHAASAAPVAAAPAAPAAPATPPAPETPAPN